MIKKHNRLSKLKKAGMVAAVAASAGLLSVSFNGNKPFFLPAYRASRIIDGDTFVTTEGQHIRLASVDTPELDLCGGKEAKEELEKLIMGKDLYLKIIYHDPGRQMAIVNSKDGSVEAKMLESGWAKIHDREGVATEEMTEATQKARREMKGIYSQQCTQVENPNNPNCQIKANIKNNSNLQGTQNKKTYYFPGCEVYKIVKVQLHEGDQWFCTEAEAKKSGFTKAENCPNR